LIASDEKDPVNGSATERRFVVGLDIAQVGSIGEHACGELRVAEVISDAQRSQARLRERDIEEGKGLAGRWGQQGRSRRDERNDVVLESGLECSRVGNGEEVEEFFGFLHANTT
jgi:hypothetical protein